MSHYCEMSNLYIQIKLCLRAVSTFVQGYRINPISEPSCSYLFYVKCPVMLSGVLLLLSPPSPEPSPSRAATGRAGSQLRSGEEPGAQHRSDTSNFSSSVNKNGKDEENESFWEYAQHIRAPFGIFHGVPGVQCSGTRNTE